MLLFNIRGKYVKNKAIEKTNKFEEYSTCKY